MGYQAEDSQETAPSGHEGALAVVPGSPARGPHGAIQDTLPEAAWSLPVLRRQEQLQDAGGGDGARRERVAVLVEPKKQREQYPVGYMGAAPAYVSVTQAQDIPCHMLSLQGSKVIHQSGAETLITDEPYALIGHVRICGGSGGQPPDLPGTRPRAAPGELHVSTQKMGTNCGKTWYNNFMIADKDREIIEKTAAKYRAKRVILFGSSLSPDRESRDIDIGVEGIDHKDFFTFYGELLCALSKPVDVIDLSTKSRFTELIRREGVPLYA